MKKIYEAWALLDHGTWREMTFATHESIQEQRAKNLLSSEAKLLYTVEADTMEEACAVQHVKMGWAPYQPLGKPAPCPRCAAIFYPEGSGECPNCGKIV